uniref:Uncharacterized protein n=1 Tax=Rhizophora mucronata TaxID=61149 RepID=A0A2P2NP50_RHIMU
MLEAKLELCMFMCCWLKNEQGYKRSKFMFSHFLSHMVPTFQFICSLMDFLYLVLLSMRPVACLVV